MQNMKNNINFGKLYLGNIFILSGFIYLIRETGIASYDLNFNLDVLLPIILVAFGLSFLDLKRTSHILVATISTLFLVVISMIFILNGPTALSYGNYNWKGPLGNFMPCRANYSDIQNDY